jgi:hypothetical protein
LANQLAAFEQLNPPEHRIAQVPGEAQFGMYIFASHVPKANVS